MVTILLYGICLLKIKEETNHDVKRKKNEMSKKFKK